MYFPENYGCLDSRYPVCSSIYCPCVKQWKRMIIWESWGGYYYVRVEYGMLTVALYITIMLLRTKSLHVISEDMAYSVILLVLIQNFFFERNISVWWGNMLACHWRGRCTCGRIDMNWFLPLKPSVTDWISAIRDPWLKKRGLNRCLGNRRHKRIILSISVTV